MRTTKYIIYSALCALMALCSSCKVSPVEWVDFTDFSGLDETKSFVPYGAGIDNEITPETLEACPTIDSEDGDGDSRTTSIAGLTLIRKFFSFSNNKSVRSYCGTYWSTDIDGNPIKLSGRIILPAKGKVSRIMVVSHFTIGRNDEAPSLTLPLEAVFATKGMAVVVPDYLGYGLTPELIHPYLCKDITARNVVDMYFAALPFLKYIDCMPEHDDIVLLGYSQGGAANLCVQQLLVDEYPSTKINIALSGSGPYDIAKTYDIMVAKDRTTFPSAVPILIQGLNVGCKLNLDYALLFQKPLLDSYNKLLNTKEYTMGQINIFLNAKYISELMTPYGRDIKEPQTAILYQSMIDNSIIHTCYPKTRQYLYHSYDDDIVPFENSEEMQKHFEEIGFTDVTYNFGHYGGHNMGFLHFVNFAMEHLKEIGLVK